MIRKRFSIDKTSKIFITIIGLTVLAFILKELQHIFIPFTLAYFLFFLFSPLNSYLQSKKIPSIIIIPLNLIIISFITFGIMSFLVDSILQFSSEFDNYGDKLNRIVRNLSISFELKDPFFKYFSIQKIFTKVDYKEIAGGVFSSAFDLLGSIFFILFFFIFIIGGHTAIYNAFRNRYVKIRQHKKSLSHEKLSLPSENIDEFHHEEESSIFETEEKLENTFKAITEQIQKYIIAKIAINLVAGIIVALVLYFLKIDFPILWGAFAFFLNFIPSIGSALALIFPALMALIQYESFGFTILIASIIAGIQTAFFNLIEPHLIGKKLDLNPIVILLSVLIWGYIWGIVGMLLAVPLTAIIKIIISNSKSENMKFITDLMGRE